MFAQGGFVRHTAKAEDVIRQSMAVPPELIRARPVITITMPQKSRKRPITGDMTQMCQDLGIEPCLTFADGMAHMQKTLKRFSDQLLDKMMMEAVRGKTL